MTKKELEKLITEYKPKYIYQRNNGELFKYEVINNNTLIEVKTGATFDLNGYAMLGKVSSNIIDLIEVGDYVNGERVTEITKNYITIDKITYCIKDLKVIDDVVILYTKFG